MEWLDEGLLLHTQAHGESSVIATFLTQLHGVTKGYIRSSKKYPLQQGNLYHIRRKARLSSHLGLLNVEPHESFAPIIVAAMSSPIKLACVNAMRALLMTSLMDHDRMDHFYFQVKQHVYEVCMNNKFGHYVLFEKDLLMHCGFGLDLTRCAVTHQTANLVYVSPKSGRAVTEEVGRPYAAQLLALPIPLVQLDCAHWSKEDIVGGLKLTGYFLSRMVCENMHRSMPEERHRAVYLLQN